MRNFKQLRIWQKGIEIASDTIRLTRTFPVSEKFGLCAQMNKCAISIPSNISEGSSRSSPKDYARFIEMALGSSFELETQLVISRTSGYGDPVLRERLFADNDDEQKMLFGFLNNLRTAL